ncbi:MAG: hypothetical protein AAB405_02780 [Patescibacteria group bacterium]
MTSASNILANPIITGVGIRKSWLNIEETEGNYNWTSLENQLAEAALFPDKKVIFRVVAGGKNTPSWLISRVPIFSFIDDNPYHYSTYGQTVNVPVFWDPLFLEKKKALTMEAGKKFASHPSIAIIGVSCANTNSDDWNMRGKTKEEKDQWLALGYTAEKLINACKELIDATMTAFPTKLVTMGMAHVPMDSNSKGIDYVPNQVVNYALTTYPERFIVQKNGLSASTPDPISTSELDRWQIIYDNKPRVGGQMMWNVTSDSTCRMNNRIAPCDIKKVLKDSITIGAHYGMQYQEIYTADILNPDLADIISYAVDILIVPSAPTGLVVQ